MRRAHVAYDDLTLRAVGALALRMATALHLAFANFGHFRHGIAPIIAPIETSLSRQAANIANYKGYS